jgi:hypothetical protein
MKDAGKLRGGAGKHGTEVVLVQSLELVPFVSTALLPRVHARLVDPLRRVTKERGR